MIDLGYQGKIRLFLKWKYEWVCLEYRSLCACVLMLRHSVVSDSLQPHDYSPPGFSVHGHSPGKNTGVGCHLLLQGIFPTQGSNPGLLHCRWILYHLNHQESQLRDELLLLLPCLWIEFSGNLQQPNPGRTHKLFRNEVLCYPMWQRNIT